MKPILKFTACILLTGAMLYVSCKKEYSCETNCIVGNQPPVAVDSILCNTQLIPFGTLSIARYGVIAVAVGNKLLFAGGANANTDPPYTQWVSLTRVDIYDTLTQTWSIAELSEAGASIVVTVGNKIFFAGGGSGMDIYDAALNTWSRVNLPHPEILIPGSAGAAVGNKIFFAGGSGWPNEPRHSDSVYIYDIATNLWSRSTAHLSEVRSPVSAISLGNKIYFAGGESLDSNGLFFVTDKIDIYDAATNSWSTAIMYEPKTGMTSIGVGNKIFWAGGFNAFNGGNWSYSYLVEMYDATTGSSSHHQLSTSSYGSTAVLKENKIHFFGGSASPNKVDVFDLTSQKWSAHTICPDVEISRTGITAAGNKIYVAGGFVNGVLSNQVWKLEF